MNIVNVKAHEGVYQVLIGKDLNAGAELAKIKKSCKILLVSDTTVFNLYGEKTIKSLTDAGFEVACKVVFEPGEESKTFDTVSEICEVAAANALTRTDIFVALGGGIVGDITGFASSCYLRGIEYVQIPTTLLSAVDSSVGGKTAVNLTTGKNLAGAFHQPILVVCDVDTFNTLPKQIYTDGCSEAIKYGLIYDEELYKHFLADDLAIEDMVARCIQIKALVVEEDEFDNGLRQILNFGHTPAHAIEILSNFETSHGQAVGKGMVMMVRLCEKEGTVPAGTTEELIAYFNRIGQDITLTYTAEELAEVSMRDKKRRGNKMGIILLERIGKAYVYKLPVEDLCDKYKGGLE